MINVEKLREQQNVCKKKNQERTRIVELQNISKRFGGTIALNQVSLTLEEGEILGLIGENGAGKSTLMNIMSGVIWPDSGKILLEGKEYAHLTPGTAQQLGIQIVHQELSLLPEMTVAENIFLGKEIKSNLGIIKKQMCNQEAARLLAEFDIELNVEQKVAELSAAQKQLVEICKSLAGTMKVLILDEPTSSLTEREMICLKRILPILKDQGIGIIFISHKLDEIQELCDSILVLRDGNVVRREQIERVTTEDMINFMVGRDIHDEYAPSGFEGTREQVLKIQDLCSKQYGEVSIQDLNLEVYAGEIVGMFGLIGSGRTEVIKAIHGLRPVQKGSILVGGEQVDKPTPKRMISRGVAWVTEDRRHEGVCLSMSVKNNMGLTIYRKVSRFGVINTQKLDGVVQKYIQQLSIKTAGENAQAQTLSGGNQQKVVLAKWLAAGPRLLILDEPTRGIDVGSKSEIHQLIRKLRDQGMAILVISSEMPELFSLADRVLVMKNGQITGEILREEKKPISEEVVMKLATLGA